MQFLKSLRPSIRSGRVTTSIRIWMHAHVKVGNAYQMEEGFVIIDKLKRIELADITSKMARDSGFDSLDALLKTARHGRGSDVYLIKFHYSESNRARETIEPISQIIRTSPRSRAFPG